MRFLGRMRRRWEEQEIFNKDMIALVNDRMKNREQFEVLGIRGQINDVIKRTEIIENKTGILKLKQENVRLKSMCEDYQKLLTTIANTTHQIAMDTTRYK